MPKGLLFCAVCVAATFTVGCSSERKQPVGSGYHPQGWADTSSSEFHATWLSANGDKIEECQQCHGADYSGGDIGISCRDSGCHTDPKGPEACGTCHGTFPSDPLPTVAPHPPHVGRCNNCHIVPADVYAAGHRDGTVDVEFSGVALTGGAMPTFNTSDGTCSGTYCHQGGTLSWRDPPNLDCTGCHGEPPSTHARFARIAQPGNCTACHPAATAATHVNGKVDLVADRCDLCHGENNRASPPVSLSGATDATDPGVGAHMRHLDATLVGRIGKPVRCEQCHAVPTSITSAGHIDTSAPADVMLPAGGVYDPNTQTCQVWCHWDKTPGPTWTDDSGDARQCDSCHDFPMSIKRDGTPHPTSPPNATLQTCLECHVFSPETHVNGTVDFAF